MADNIETTDQLQGRTLISPWQSVQLNVTWNVEWTQGQTYTYRPAFDAANRYVGIDTTLTENGSNRSSIWAFGASYLDLFYRQYQTLLYDLQSAGPDATEFGDANRTRADASSNNTPSLTRGASSTSASSPGYGNEPSAIICASRASRGAAPSW